jgi:hypothetical protein
VLGPVSLGAKCVSNGLLYELPRRRRLFVVRCRSQLSRCHVAAALPGPARLQLSEELPDLLRMSRVEYRVHIYVLVVLVNDIGRAQLEVRE